MTEIQIPTANYYYYWKGGD